MFTIDSNTTDLNVRGKDVTKVLFSMNSPQIATPELSTEDARCYVLVFHEGNTYRVHIGLFLLTSNRRFYYAYSGNPVGDPQLHEAMDDASRFAEEMGFILDELKISSMSVDERNHWFDSQAMFAPPKPVETPVVEVKTQEAPVAAATPQETKVEAPAPVQEDKQSAPAAPATPAISAQQIYPDDPKIVAEVPQPAIAASAPASVSAPAPAQEPAAAPMPEAQSEPSPPPVPEQPVTAAAVPQRKSATAKPKPAPVPHDQQETEETDEVKIDQAPFAAVKPEPQPQKSRSKKAIQAATGTVSREYEALARLLASF